MRNESEQSGNVNFWRVVVGVLAVVALGITGLNFQRYNLPPFSQNQTTTQETTEKVVDPTLGSVDQPANSTFPTTDELAALVNNQNSSWVAVRQQNLRLTLSGQVDDQNSKEVLEKSMRESYGDLAISELTINPNAQSEKWLTTSSVLIKEFASHIIDGGFAINDTTLHLIGDVPNQASKDAIAAAIANLEQPSSTDDQLKLADLKSPTLTAKYEDGRFFMFGLVPSQELLDEITQAAVDLYGADDVTSNLLVNETTFAPIALARWQENLVTFFPFGDYKIQIKDGNFIGELQGGIVFEQNSANLTNDGRAFLDIFPALINRSNGQVSVVGHTDNTGTQETNQTLSEQRANAVADYLISKEIASDRIVATGMGDLEPTASNSLEEGRQQNRRVEIIISR